MEGASVTLDFDALPLEIWTAIAGFFYPHELAVLCRVSKLFRELFRPILWRHMSFRWPTTNKKDRYPGKRLLESDFDQRLVSLTLETYHGRQANASWPIAMKKTFKNSQANRTARLATICDRKTRSAVLKRLRAARALSSLAVVQFPRQVLVHRPPQWTSSLLQHLGLASLRSLTLVGPASMDAEAAASIILASRGRLRALRVHGSAEALDPMLYLSRRRPAYVEDVRLFWARVMSLVAAGRGSSSSSSGRVDRADEPPLRLRELAVDDFAGVDFSSLTDPSRLRRLALHDHLSQEGEASPGAARHLRAAVNLEALAVTRLRRDTLALVEHVHAARPRPGGGSSSGSGLAELTVRLTSTRLLKEAPGFLCKKEWRRLSLRPERGSVNLMKWTENIPALGVGLEELHLALRLPDKDAVPDIIRPLSRLRLLSVEFSQYHQPDDQRKLEDLVGKWVAEVLLRHERDVAAAAPVETTPIATPASALTEVRVVLERRIGHDTRSPRGETFFEEWSYFKSWQSGAAGGDEVAVAALPEREKEDGEIIRYPAPDWRLVRHVRRLPAESVGAL